VLVGSSLACLVKLSLKLLATRKSLKLTTRRPELRD
jgi:hypothetical protein